jgi:glycosyltransferase involved in cell wall biosynthesis
MTALCIACLILAAIPAALFLRNACLYISPPGLKSGVLPCVSVLIPARNEEHNIGEVIDSALSNRGAKIEVIVADDGSEDRTAAIVRDLATKDHRVRLIETPTLPPGWNGKQHACHTLAQQAKMPMLCFVDADVRLAPDALSRMTAFLDRSGASLVSGVPQQMMGSWMEALLIPLIQFVLLGFLPFDFMRRSSDPAYSAGCGQLFMAAAKDYHRVGGHSAIRQTLHDGIKLPVAFRAAGFKTDLFDATDIAQCRMYHNAGEVWSGLSKNATEGMAAPSRLPLFTILLVGGQVLPFVLLLWAAMAAGARTLALVGAAAVLSYLPRAIAIRRFRQPAWSSVLHPVGIGLLLLIQWFALGRKLLGKPSSWRGRDYELQST